MEQRSDNYLHNIQVVRRGLIEKVRNVDSHGKPDLMIKKLKDICDTENARLGGSHVNCESECFPVVDRTSKTIEPENNKFGCLADDEVSSQSAHYNSGEITLKQLMERYKSKKRKFATPSPTSTSPKQADGCYQPEEDDDLEVPLCHLKLGNSKKANRKRRCTNRNLFASPNKPVSIKVEVVLEPEVSPQLRTDLPEVPEPIADTLESDFSMPRNLDSSNCPSNIWMDKKPNSDATTCSELSDVVDSEEKIPVSFAEEQKLCTLNQISNDQFEHVDPKYIYSASEVLAEVNNQEDRCYTENSQKELFAPSRSTKIVATANNQSLGMYCLRNCSDMDKCSAQSTNNVGIHIPKAMMPNSTDSAGLHYADDVCMSGDGDKEVLLSNQEFCSVDDPIDKCILSCNLQTCSGSDNSLPFVDDINDKEQLTECCLTGNCLDDENQPLKSSSICEEKDLTLTSQSQNTLDQISASELSQPPERLLSTRKAISPCSQERLCQAMNSIEIIDDLENYKCKEKLTFGNENSEGSRLADASTTKDFEGSARLKKVKVFIGPKQIARRWKTERRGSPPKGNLQKQSSSPKGNLEGPRLSRSLPQLNTGCTSITRCSESAIAFSQRQMQDMESLALKLMSELKSMKDMVEEKLLFEAYRTSSLKNDADEVKIAIKSATKVEETTRKWLSMMTRDCTRFCKIMKLSQNGGAVPKNTVHREGRKISFADETGGMLCHVSYFEDPELTLESDSDKQEDLIL